MKGDPSDIILLGTTNLSRSTIRDHMDEIEDVFTAANYHLIENNCHKFSDELARYLLDNGIPADIRHSAANIVAKLLQYPFVNIFVVFGIASLNNQDNGSSSGILASSRTMLAPMMPLLESSAAVTYPLIASSRMHLRRD